MSDVVTNPIGNVFQLAEVLIKTHARDPGIVPNSIMQEHARLENSDPVSLTAERFVRCVDRFYHVMSSELWAGGSLVTAQ